MERNRIGPVLVGLVCLAGMSVSGCSGGSEGRATTPGPSGSFVASFTPDQTSPGNSTVSLSQAPGGGGDLVVLNVGVTGVDDVFGASFRIAYDSALVEFDNWSAGSLLESSGNSALYQVAVVQPGIVEVGASCAGCTSGVNVTSTQTIVQLLFRATDSGSSAIDFVTGDLLDSTASTAPISGLGWFGGTLVAN